MLDTSKPYYWLNEPSRLFLTKGESYIPEDKDPVQHYEEIAEAAERRLGLPGYAEKFKQNLAAGFYTISSPAVTNFGREKGLPISCFGCVVPDNIIGIFDKVKEVAVQTKNAGGTSGYFGLLRDRGARISTGGDSLGPVAFMRLFDTTIDVVAQSSMRRGMFTAYLPITSPDIEEFLRIQDDGDPIQHLQFGVVIPDEWMEACKAGDKEKQRIWALLVAKKFASGFPYILWSGNAARNRPKVYVDGNYQILASNGCVVATERAPSQHGLLTVKELFDLGGKLQLTDGKRQVASSPMKLRRTNEPVFKVTLSNGMTHTITADHKLPVRVGSWPVQEEMRTCDKLNVGDLVAVQTTKGLFGKVHKPKEAFLLGLYQADGTQTEQSVYIDVWENDFDLIEEIEEAHTYVYNTYAAALPKLNGKEVKNNKFVDCTVALNLQGKAVAKRRLCSTLLKRALNFTKGSVPQWLWEADECTQWQYLRGLYYADGSASLVPRTPSVRGSLNSDDYKLQVSLTNVNRAFLSELQLLLTNLGLSVQLHPHREAGTSLLPNGRGGSQPYPTKASWRLVMNGKNDGLVFEQRTGFLTRKEVSYPNRKYRDNSKKHHKIVSIEPAGVEDVYCPTVDTEEHLWVCNGFVTANCNEILLPSTPEESFVCCLSSMNLARYDAWKDTDAVEVLTYFLDAVMSEFIEKTEGMDGMGSSNRFAKRHRALGLGVAGWHNLLQSRMLPFESMEAKYLTHEVFKLLDERTLKATKELAVLFGEPEVMKGTGMRNSTRLALAPTKSTAFICGQISQSIEPEDSVYYVKNLAKGRYTIRNPYLKKLLAEKGKDTEEVWRTILENGGSVQTLAFLSDHEKAVFKTFSEISQKEIIIQASIRQRYLDQGQSLNIKVSPTTKAKEVSDLMFLAWELGVCGMYYQKSANPAQQLSRSIMECSSCGG